MNFTYACNLRTESATHACLIIYPDLVALNRLKDCAVLRPHLRHRIRMLLLPPPRSINLLSFITFPHHLLRFRRKFISFSNNTFRRRLISSDECCEVAEQRAAAVNGRTVYHNRTNLVIRVLCHHKAIGFFRQDWKRIRLQCDTRQNPK